MDKEDIDDLKEFIKNNSSQIDFRTYIIYRNYYYPNETQKEIKQKKFTISKNIRLDTFHGHGKLEINEFYQENLDDSYYHAEIIKNESDKLNEFLTDFNCEFVKYIKYGDENFCIHMTKKPQQKIFKKRNL